MIANQTPLERVVAVVVAYYPNAEALTALLLALAPQVDHVAVVDNTPVSIATVPALIDQLSLPHINLIRLGSNYGIAKALNIGIEWALEVGATHVLLSDQDSLPVADMVQQLLAVMKRLALSGERVGCVAPAFRDLSTGVIHKFQVPSRGLFYATCAGDQATPWAEVISSITSGSLIPISIFDEVGLMREDFFIDFVDTEWCFRARYCGYKLYGTSLALMDHRVGGEIFRAWVGSWKSFNGYSHDRLYYQYRNVFFIIRGNTISSAWKLRFILTWLSNIYVYVFFAPNRFINFKAILKGLCHGIRGFSGPINSVAPRSESTSPKNHMGFGE